MSHRGIAHSLCAKLRSAQASAERGNTIAHDSQLAAFRREVEAQAGSHGLDAGEADVLRAVSELL